MPFIPRWPLSSCKEAKEEPLVKKPAAPSATPEAINLQSTHGPRC